MKLESLKNGKYSLTPEKMGELVGGSVCCQTSGPGNYGDVQNCSCDVVCNYSGKDVIIHNGRPVYRTVSPLQGQNDIKLQNLFIAQHGGFCA